MSSLFTAIAGSLGAGAGAAAAAGTAASTLSTVLSIGTALASIGQGAAARDRLVTEGQFTLAQANQTMEQGAGEQVNLAREYRQLVSEQQAIMLANGVRLGVGTPASIVRSTMRQQDRSLDVSRKNTLDRARVLRLRARGLFAEGNSAMMAGLTDAMTVGLGQARLTG